MLTVIALGRAGLGRGLQVASVLKAVLAFGCSLPSPPSLVSRLSSPVSRPGRHSDLMLFFSLLNL